MKPVIAQRWALAALSVSMLLSSMGTSIANVALPTLARAFGASFQQVQWVVIAYLLAVTTLVVGVGRLGDLVGRRRLLLGGVAMFTLGSALCALAPALWLLIAARAVQGVGAAAMMALSMAFVGAAVPKEKTGSAMGLLGTMSAVGTALGPTLGGVLIAGAGWRAIFLINIPLGMLALLLARRFLPADRPVAGPVRFDHAGTLLLALTLAAYALAVTMGRGSMGMLNAALLCAAGMGACLFVLVESKAASPLIRMAMLRTPELGAGFAMSVLVTTVMMATLVVGPFYLSGTLALDAARVGLVMSCGPVASALGGMPAGRAVDRFGAPRMVVAGLVALAAGSAALPMAAARFGVPGYIGALIGVSAGYALFQAANNTAVMTAVQAGRRGVISGMLSLSRNLGLITGASVMGALFSAAGFGPTFAAAAVLIGVALVIALALRMRGKGSMIGCCDRAK